MRARRQAEKLKFRVDLQIVIENQAAQMREVQRAVTCDTVVQFDLRNENDGEDDAEQIQVEGAT